MNQIHTTKEEGKAVEGWHRIILSLEDSEIVSETVIENWKQAYNENEYNEYRVRVLGLEPHKKHMHSLTKRL